MTPDPRKDRRREGPATPAPMLRRAARYLGALLLVGVGTIHLHEYLANYYRVIPVIGPLFLANFVVAIALALLIAAPVELLGRPGHSLLRLLALGAMGFAATTIVGLAISEASTLFGFHEHGYRTTIQLSLAFEGAVILLFALFLGLELSTPTARAERVGAAPGRMSQLPAAQR